MPSKLINQNQIRTIVRPQLYAVMRLNPTGWWPLEFDIFLVSTFSSKNCYRGLKIMMIIIMHIFSP